MGNKENDMTRMVKVSFICKDEIVRKITNEIPRSDIINLHTQTVEMVD